MLPGLFDDYRPFRCFQAVPIIPGGFDRFRMLNVFQEVSMDRRLWERSKRFGLFAHGFKGYTLRGLLGSVAAELATGAC